MNVLIRMRHFVHDKTTYLRAVCRPAGYRIAAGFVMACLLSACNVTKYLEKEKGGPLLAKNAIELKTDKPLPLDQKTPLLYELSALYRQKPNERNLLALGSRTRLWYYFRCRNKPDKKFARWAMSKIAEPPSYYSRDLAVRTANNLQNYMHQRGYFKAKSNFDVKFYDKSIWKKPAPPETAANAAVTYTLDLGPLYHIGKVTYESQDSNIQHILQLTAGGSLLKPGAPVDSRSFDAEKARLTSELKNRGYAFFIPNFVEFVGDSALTVSDITVEVLPQNDTSLHKTYIIGNIAVFSDLVPDLSSIRKDTTIEGIYFATSDPDFEVKPFRIYNAITLRPGTIYRQEDFDKTTHNLNALGIFKFVTIRPQQDSVQSGKINVTISFSLNNRLSLGWGTELNSSNNSGSTLSGRLLGASANGSAVNRNLFHGAENITTSLAYSLEFDLSSERNSLIFSQDIRLQNELVFPRYFDYLGMWRTLRRLHLINPAFYNYLRSDGQVRLSLNYNYLDLRGFYVYNLFNGAYGYNIRPNLENQYAIDNVGIDILRPQLRPRFDSLFGQNEFLIRSFGNQLFTGVLLRSFSYTYSSRPNAFGEHWFFRLNTELSGLEILAVNKLWELPFGKQTWTLSDLEYSKYAKIDVTGSYTREFPQSLTLAFRLGAGAVAPFGDTHDVPYVKQFFVGGPSSIRAWRIRELGPGGNPENAQILPFFQAADFRFEFNGELRFPLFWWVKGAIFLDGGNIWTFKPDPERPDAQLTWNSYKNIALGTGFGLRFDFDYFVFRFDWGLKLRRPYYLEAKGYWVDWTGAAWRDISNFNLAVGYPF